MVVCVSPLDGYFFRINSENKWPRPVALLLADCRFLRHDSYLECNTLLEFSDYIIEESLAATGMLGQLPTRYAQAICVAADGSQKISNVDKAKIRAALAC